MLPRARDSGQAELQTPPRRHDVFQPRPPLTSPPDDRFSSAGSRPLHFASLLPIEHRSPRPFLRPFLTFLDTYNIPSPGALRRPSAQLNAPLNPTYDPRDAGVCSTAPRDEPDPFVTDRPLPPAAIETVRAGPCDTRRKPFLGPAPIDTVPNAGAPVSRPLLSALSCVRDPSHRRPTNGSRRPQTERDAVDDNTAKAGFAVYIRHECDERECAAVPEKCELQPRCRSQSVSDATCFPLCVVFPSVAGPLRGVGPTEAPPLPPQAV
ncbi:hypothetical protein B0T14DRAFT_191567 [Immersiella caudata]|uniref:Uncharacterized protein n=1 Tax=Immersiella caudata TaxID=314043 RepID=A0AA39WYF8_9PEZI|nr:hypothetical protein B0T14DRAFT_191567 [Immersiella caudata]